MWRGKKYRQKFVDRVTDVRRKDPRALECWNRSERIYYFLLFISFSFVWMCILFKFRMCIQCWGRDTYTRNSNKLTSYTKAKGNLFPSSHWNCGFLTSGVACSFLRLTRKPYQRLRPMLYHVEWKGERKRPTEREREERPGKFVGEFQPIQKTFFVYIFSLWYEWMRSFSSARVLFSLLLWDFFWFCWLARRSCMFIQCDRNGILTLHKLFVCKIMSNVTQRQTNRI